MRLRNASIGGRLFCRYAQLKNRTGPALGAERLEVEGSMHLENLTAIGRGGNGAVRLLGARIGTELQFGAVLHNPSGPALDLRSVSVRGLCLPREAVNCPAERGSRWQDRVLLDGLTYSSIPEPADDLRGQWLTLLRECAPYAAQPYQMLASVYRAVGDEKKSRFILIAQQDDLRDRGGRRTGLSGARAGDWLLRTFTGYGYRTWPAFVGLALMLNLALGLGLLAGHMRDDDRWVAAHTDKAAHAQVGSACSTAEQVGLGVERALSLFIGNAGVQERCAIDSQSVPGQIVIVSGWILQVAAWAFATLVIISFTGLVRKT